MITRYWKQMILVERERWLLGVKLISLRTQESIWLTPICQHHCLRKRMVLNWILVKGHHQSCLLFLNSPRIWDTSKSTCLTRKRKSAFSVVQKMCQNTRTTRLALQSTTFWHFYPWISCFSSQRWPTFTSYVLWLRSCIHPSQTLKANQSLVCLWVSWFWSQWLRTSTKISRGTDRIMTRTIGR